VIEFSCPYCQAAMTVPTGRVSESEACPACGYAIIVPSPADPPAISQGESEQAIRTWWASNKRAVIIISSVVAAGLLVLYLLSVYYGRYGMFPPRAEVEELLAKHDYFPDGGDIRETRFEGRMLRAFCYCRNPTGDKPLLGNISLWCEIDDDSRVAVMSSIVMKPTSYRKPPDGGEIPYEEKWMADGLPQLYQHSQHVWKIAEKLTSIRYDPLDMLDSREAARTAPELISTGKTDSRWQSWRNMPGQRTTRSASTFRTCA